MEEYAVLISLSVENCIKLLYAALEDSSFAGELLDRYEIFGPDGSVCVVLVFEKFYHRVGARLTMTITIDDLTGRTRVHWVSAGGRSFDLGAAERFDDAVAEALGPYVQTKILRE